MSKKKNKKNINEVRKTDLNSISKQMEGDIKSDDIFFVKSAKLIKKREPRNPDRIAPFMEELADVLKTSGKPLGRLLKRFEALSCNGDFFYIEDNDFLTKLKEFVEYDNSSCNPPEPPYDKRFSLEKIQGIWHTLPDLRFGQLMHIYRMKYKTENGGSDPFGLSDKDFVYEFEKIMIGFFY